MALGGDGSWRPTPRHPIEQTGKVREIDACNLSKINDLSNIWEKLQLPSANLAMITGRRLQTLYTKKHNKKPRLRGIVFDESKAYGAFELSLITANTRLWLSRARKEGCPSSS